MKIVEIYCVDYCGYTETYEVPDDIPDCHVEDWAEEKFLEDFTSQFDLLGVGDGEYTDSDNLDEDGELIDDQDVTTISARLVL